MARGAGLLGQIILAWLLSPEDFGKIGLAYTIAAFFGLITNPGIEEVLIQRRRSFRLWVTPAFWLGLCLGFVGGVGMIAAAPLGMLMYKEPELLGLVAVLAIAAPIGATSLVPNVSLRASLRFRLLAEVSAGEIVLLQLLTVLCAYLGFGAYSFVVPVPLTSAARSIAGWIIVRPRVGMRPQVRRWRYLLPKISLVFANRLVTMAIAQGDYVVLGLLAPKAVVGAYYFAFVLAAAPVRAVMNNVISVMFPALTVIARDTVRQGEAALKAVRLVAMVAMPLCFLQAALCKPVIQIFFGHKWAAASPLAQILSIGFAFDAVTWPVAALLQAKGQFRRVLAYSYMPAPLFFFLVLAGAWRWSALGVAAGVALFYVIVGPIYVFLVLHPHGIKGSQIAALHLVPAALAAGSVMTGAAASSALTRAGAAEPVQIAVIIIVSCILYVPASWWLARDLWVALWMPFRAASGRT